jgi:hypothetical protein
MATLVVRPLIFTQRSSEKDTLFNRRPRKLAGCLGDHDLAGLGMIEQSRSDVDVVAQQIVVLDQGFAGVYRGPQTSVEG